MGEAVGLVVFPNQLILAVVDIADGIAATVNGKNITVIIVSIRVGNIIAKPSPLGKGDRLRWMRYSLLLGEGGTKCRMRGFLRCTAVTSSDLAWQSLRSATFPKGEGFCAGRYCVLIRKYAAKSCEKTGNYEHFKSGQSTVPLSHCPPHLTLSLLF